MQRDQADHLIGLLAEPNRLRVAAALILGATTSKEVAAATGLGARAVATALNRLVEGGLVSVEGRDYLFEALGNRARGLTSRPSVVSFP